MRAIETRYAGHRFRSRLEARWAVFFDAAGIEWVYEPEGFEMPWRLDCERDGETFRYLPDFYLPGLGMWAEVKGRLTEEEAWKVCTAAAVLHGGRDGSREPLVVLGNIPAVNQRRVPAALWFWKGDLYASPWLGGTGRATAANGETQHVVAHDWSTWAEWDPSIRWQQLTTGLVSRCPERMRKAYDKARMARFEFGEEG